MRRGGASFAPDMTGGGRRMNEDWLWMTAADLGREIGAGRIDPRDLTRGYLDAIMAHPDRDRIYARVTPERAMAEAAAAHARQQAGQRRSLLDGVPVSWKDLFDTAGIATEAGTALLAGRVPDRDAPVVVNGTEAGLVCLGKTHMSELAFSGLGLNPVTATPPNVNDPKAVPGGSSSGAAASVAFGLAAVGIGSDTGGSVRLPAAWNDLVGLKTTHGRITNEGVVPLCESLDTVGPLTRSVEDAALMLAVLEGGKPADLRGASLEGTRFLVLETLALDDVREAPMRGFEQALKALEAAGARIERRRIPEVSDAAAQSGLLFATEAYAIWREAIEAAPEKMFPRILERFRGGADTNGADYVAALRRQAEFRKRWTLATAGYDAVLTPSSPILPPEADRLMTDSAYYVTENLLALRNTRIGNLFGLSGLTLPTGVPSTGIQFLGQPFGEERLLRIGKAAEAALRAA